MDFVIPSPDGQQNAHYHFAGEIRFGPAYYALEIGSLTFGQRLFGKRGLWSPDSRFFAAEEWLTTDEKRGPHTRLLVIDTISRCEYRGGEATKGFIEAQRFEGAILHYDKLYYPQQTRAHFSVDLSTVHWKTLA